MERKSFEDMACSVAQCLESIGEWWTMLLVRDAFFGICRFDDFQERLGISRNVLARRLAKLVAAGIFQKQRYQEHPPRYEYRLTDKGRDLWPVLTTLRQWGDKYRPVPAQPLQVQHKACGEVAHFALHCAECGGAVAAHDVRALQRPAAVTPAANRGDGRRGRARG